MRAPRLSLAAPACLAALVLGAAVAGCGGGGSKAFPKEPQRLVAGDATSADVAVALGLDPVAAIGGDPGWKAPLDGTAKRMRRVELRPATARALTVLAAHHPDSIVASTVWRRKGLGDSLESVAPTLYLGAAGTAGSVWRSPLEALAAELGMERRAARVIAALDNRAAALRPQVAGRTVAVIRITAPSSFTAGGDYVPTSLVVRRDLGLRNFRFKPQQYPYDCPAAPQPPRACRTNGLYAGLVGFMGLVDALLVETGWTTPAAAAAFERDPQFRALRAAKAKHVVEAGSFTELGPLGVAYLYSSVARAFGIAERHAVLGRSSVSVTLDPATRKLCWARLGAPSSGELRAGQARMALERARGCAAAPSAVAAALASGGAAQVSFGRAQAKLEPGALDVARS